MLAEETFALAGHFVIMFSLWVLAEVFNLNRNPCCFYTGETGTVVLVEKASGQRIRVETSTGRQWWYNKKALVLSPEMPPVEVSSQLVTHDSVGIVKSISAEVAGKDNVARASVSFGSLRYEISLMDLVQCCVSRPTHATVAKPGDRLGFAIRCRNDFDTTRCFVYRAYELT